jgi:cytoskeletal protein CcmA (bactofilin family)
MTDELPRRRLLDRIRGSSLTIIGPRTRIVGNVVTDGSLMLSGNFEGDGKIGGSFSIAGGASWKGDISAGDAVIAGTLTGDLTVKGKLEVGSKAVVRGKVTARLMAVACGAIVEGPVVVTSGQPVIDFEEKRAQKD